VAILQDTLDQALPADQIPCALNAGLKSFRCLDKEETCLHLCVYAKFWDIYDYQKI